MDLFFRHKIPACGCKESIFRLACSFLLGLLSGGCIFTLTSDSFSSLMRGAAFGSMSIISLLSVLLLPFLFSAFAVYVRQSWLLMPISFLKAFFFSFLYVGLSCTFGGAGWLVRTMLMFSDILTLPVLWWFWLKLLQWEGQGFYRQFLLPMAVEIAIACFDFSMVSPWAAQLIT